MLLQRLCAERAEGQSAHREGDQVPGVSRSGGSDRHERQLGREKESRNAPMQERHARQRVTAVRNGCQKDDRATHVRRRLGSDRYRGGVG